jgi:hypothetical protein
MRLHYLLGFIFEIGAVTFSITALIVMTYSIMKCSIMTLIIKGIFVTISTNNIQHK